MESDPTPSLLTKHCPSRLSSIQIDAADRGLFEECFLNAANVRKWINEWIASEYDCFFRRGIFMLPTK